MSRLAKRGSYKKVKVKIKIKYLKGETDHKLATIRKIFLQHQVVPLLLKAS